MTIRAKGFCAETMLATEGRVTLCSLVCRHRHTHLQDRTQKQECAPERSSTWDAEGPKTRSKEKLYLSPGSCSSRPAKIPTHSVVSDRPLSVARCTAV